MTKVKVTDRLYLTWDDFNWIILRKRKKLKAGARDTYHPRYYAKLEGACVALLNEVPKELPVSGEIAALAKSVKDAEARICEVVNGLEISLGFAGQVAGEDDERS